LAGGGIELHDIPGGHDEILAEPNVRTLAGTVTSCLTKVDSCQGQGHGAPSAVSLV